MAQLRAFNLRDKLKGSDFSDLADGVADIIVAPTAGTGGDAPSPHGLSSAHHSGEITASQASWAAYEENGGTTRPAYNANRMTGALAHVVPNLTDTYDLGTSTKWWRQQYVSQINGAVYTENVSQLLGGWFIVGYGQGTLQTPSAYLQVETATVVGTITSAVAQVETATVSGTATAVGSMTATVTAAGMTGSPVAVAVSFVTGQTASQLADAIKAALSLDAGVYDFFTIGGTGATVRLTAKTAIANDATMNIALSGASAQGFPDAATSANTTAGVASGAGTVSVTVTAAGMTGSPITVTTGLDATAGMTATQVATMLAANLPGANATIDAFFTITSDGTDLILTAKAYTVANDATMNVAITNGTCTGLTAAPTSANTTAGGNLTAIDFGTALSVNDFIQIRSHDAAGAVNSEYMQVVALVSGTVYTVTRNLEGAGSVPVWLDGTPWLNRGYTGNGQVELNAYDTPRIQLITQGATYNAQTEVIRIGDLNTGWGYVAETYGIAIGEYAASKPNITMEPTNGLRIRNYDTDVLAFDTSGNAKITGKLQMPDVSSAIAIGETPPTKASGAGAGSGIWLDRTGLYCLSTDVQVFVLDATTGATTIGPVGVGTSNVLITGGALSLRNNTTTKITLQADGDIFVGTDVSAAATTSLAIFTEAQTYNGEAGFATGDILIGDNSAGKANIFWDQSEGDLIFRYGTSSVVEILGSGEIWIKEKLTVGDLAAGSRQALEVAAGSADLLIGSESQDGNVYLRNMAGANKIHLDGTNGIIDITGGTLKNSTGALRFQSSSNGSIVVTPNGTGDFYVNTTDIYVDTSASRLGVGTNLPAVKCHVKGPYFAATYPMNIIAEDTTAMAINVGGGISFRGVYKAADSSSADFAIVQGAKELATDDNYAGCLRVFTRPAGLAIAEAMRVSSTKNLKLAGTATRGTTEGTNHIDLFDGTAPVGTLANGVSLYSSSGAFFAMDAAGVAVNITGHIAATGTAVHGLGTISTQAADNVAITGGSAIGLTSLQVGSGTRKAFSVADGDANVYIGSDTQAGDLYMRDTAGTAQASINGQYGNIGLGTSGDLGGPTYLLAAANGTAPGAGVANTVLFYSTDDAAGHTIPSFFCEGTNVLATGQADSASSVRVKMRINGTVVTLLAI